MPLTGRDLLTLKDYTTEEVWTILDLAATLKEKQKKGEAHRLLEGMTLGMIFQKASTRTRVSFEVGMWQLGGHALFLEARDLQLGRGEPVKDTAKVLSRYVDAIMIRTFAQEEVEELAAYASVPVINGLTDTFHPCQALADLFTVREHFGSFKGVKLAYVGDGNNMAHSLMLGCATVGMEISVASPLGYEPQTQIVALAVKKAARQGTKVTVGNDPYDVVKGATVVYTDVWASMGQEQETSTRQRAFHSFQVNDQLLSAADGRAIVLHCLPAHRGEEISEAALEGPQSAVFDQAENRLHVQKALLALLMGGKLNNLERKIKE